MIEKNKAILLCYCHDKQGIIAKVTQYLQANEGNILDLEQHVDQQNGMFFMRVEWDLSNFRIANENLSKHFDENVALELCLSYKIHFSHKKLKIAIFASNSSHCLYDILQRYISKEWDIEIPLIISNHKKFRGIAETYKIPFYYIPIQKSNKKEQEEYELKLLKENGIDLIVLARYMQILSNNFVSHYPNRIINIHHSFLPAFAGAKPYHQAFERGVKLIGATSHYVTPELDAGPIIAQGVEHITHRDRIADLKRKGKNLEKLVLSNGIWLHLNHKILTLNNRTIIFN